MGVGTIPGPQRSRVTRSRPHRPTFAVVAATRPNFMKVGPVIQALRADADIEFIHTGQHYDSQMSATFFEELGLPEPDVNLDVGSGPHGWQTGAVMAALERRLIERPVDALLVPGDVNSTLAAALTAAKLGIPVAHIEAGLRSADWSMPEEINRVLTDRLSTWLFTTVEDAEGDLLAEGIERNRIHFVGNTMIDTLLAHLEQARGVAEHTMSRLGVGAGYSLLTLHRPSNVDGERLQGLLDAVGELAMETPFVFPVHPRTAHQLSARGIRIPEGVTTTEPLSYLPFLGLMDRARLVLTDSGGIQEETSVLGVPCLTLRENTERPVTCELGTNTLVGVDPDRIIAEGRARLGHPTSPAVIPLWDGKAGERIAGALLDDFS